MAIATEKMHEVKLVEWPELKHADMKKTIGVWVQDGDYTKSGSNTEVETFIVL